MLRYNWMPVLTVLLGCLGQGCLVEEPHVACDQLAPECEGGEVVKQDAAGEDCPTLVCQCPEGTQLDEGLCRETCEDGLKRCDGTVRQQCPQSFWETEEDCAEIESVCYEWNEATLCDAADQTLCAGDPDCTEDFQFCMTPGTVQCGIIANIPDTCTSDLDCEESGCEVPPCELICEIIHPPCATAHLECITPCPAAPCATGYLCDEASGRCEPQACPDTYACPDWKDCDSEGEFIDAFGCALRDCESDAECSGGFCVNSHCYERPGKCAYHAA